MIPSLQEEPPRLGGASDLRRTYPMFTARRRRPSRAPFPLTAPLLSLPAKEILCSVTNGSGAPKVQQCGGGPLHLPPPPKLLPLPPSTSGVLPDNRNCVLNPPD